MYCCQGWENEWSFTNVTGVCDHHIGTFQVECFEQFIKLLSYFFIQVNNVELMVFATAQEMAMHSMMRDNVYHGTNVQVIFSIKTFFFIIFLLL